MLNTGHPRRALSLRSRVRMGASGADWIGVSRGPAAVALGTVSVRVVVCACPCVYRCARQSVGHTAPTRQPSVPALPPSAGGHGLASSSSAVAPMETDSGAAGEPDEAS
eukprot:6409064-Prymnesium_polylepis.1